MDRSTRSITSLSGPHLQRSAPPTVTPSIKVGCQVMITSGALAGARGVVVRQAESDKCYLELEHLRPGVFVVVRARQLVAT